MKAVVDTNVLVSALYDPESPPGRILFLAIEDKVKLYAPESVRAELERALVAKLGYTAEEWKAAFTALPVEWIEEAIYSDRLAEARDAIADASDAPLVALALALGVGVISGDRAFHPLRKPVVRAWRPREAADASGGRGRGSRGGGGPKRRRRGE